jgi:hypothetical protein
MSTKIQRDNFIKEQKDFVENLRLSIDLKWDSWLSIRVDFNNIDNKWKWSLLDDGKIIQTSNKLFDTLRNCKQDVYNTLPPQIQKEYMRGLEE